ncbi:class I SAM-dependent methyltransferase [Aurantiacibacter hainanensis]|uniref:class I SAM-dependent methyltransferase n=1 Tax=Aurantiacibacter hainanensis TaxID=3076114 RepID=UPI0030C73A1D
MTVTPDYNYHRSGAAHTHGYLMPVVERVLELIGQGKTIFELGCGNGSNAAYLTSKGFSIVGVDPSESGIAIAQANFPECRLELGSTDDDLGERYGQFDVVLSLEVIEHVYSPKRYVEVVRSLLKPGGCAIISTPYHSYLKNLTLAVTGKMDDHFTALWEGGHIKFWSPNTLTSLFENAGFKRTAFYRVGRVPSLAKSMILVFSK